MSIKSIEYFSSHKIQDQLIKLFVAFNTRNIPLFLEELSKLREIFSLQPLPENLHEKSEDFALKVRRQLKPFYYSALQHIGKALYKIDGRNDVEIDQNIIIRVANLLYEFNIPENYSFDALLRSEINDSQERKDLILAINILILHEQILRAYYFTVRDLADTVVAHVIFDNMKRGVDTAQKAYIALESLLKLVCKYLKVDIDTESGALLFKTSLRSMITVLTKVKLEDIDTLIVELNDLHTELCANPEKIMKYFKAIFDGCDQIVAFQFNPDSDLDLSIDHYESSDYFGCPMRGHHNLIGLFLYLQFRKLEL